MNSHKVIRIQEHPEWKNAAAQWFHEKWRIPIEAYQESMEECLDNGTDGNQREKAVPQWYVVLEENKIIAGLGVIENDFHDRKDLAPNVCAVYVEENYRCQGIAGEMLSFVSRDMKEKGIETLYLVTDHTSFYERYQWEFLCMVQGEGEEEMTRMYVHREK